ncbi:cytochrome P450 1A2 [Patella vulgata]|uniref:cytochrome P450 1A2 n=1 Tax=Patella vulgata TaxID=6465 RepID=UPI0021806AC7|nr:cytochrome P450 1A2 [Patella vulgata]XP_055958139.1 cytochrome P450 1A2 [Patella vulgata]XP_055958140.1 cytochrome P450 1A2 [Patella vulgata]XP_055958141.1 cytochrome P450 1A2 [Patella vulgata]
MVIVDSIQHILEELIKYIPDVVYDYIPESKITRSLLIGTATGALAYIIFKKRYRLPPGPFKWPIIGSTVLYTKGSIAKKFFDLSKQYGPAFTLYLGSSRIVVLNRIDVINEALLTKGAHYANRMILYSTKVMLKNGDDIIFSNYSTEWKLRRKIAGRAMRLFMVGGSFNIKLEEAVSKTVEVMLKEKGPFDPKPYMFFTTLNILGAMVFGTKYDIDDEEYLTFLNQLEGISSAQSAGMFIENVFPPARLFPSQRFRQFTDLLDQFMDRIDTHVQRIRNTFKPGNITNFTESILQAEKEIKDDGEENMTDYKSIHVVSTVFDIFLAGNDTSRQTLYWALMYIAGMPDVQKKIQDEVDSVVGNDRYPTTSDREGLPYTDAVLHEVMRIGTVAPVGVPHMTSCDTTIGEYEVPKDTLIFINHWGIQNDPDNWEDVEKFKPERFLDSDGKMAPKPENWLPFSAGRRVCLGETMAKPELHLILAALCQRLTITMEPGVPVKIGPMVKGLTIVPHPYKIVVQERIRA